MIDRQFGVANLTCMFSVSLSVVQPGGIRFRVPHTLSPQQATDLLRRPLPAAGDLGPNESYLGIAERIAGRPIVWAFRREVKQDCTTDAELRAELGDPQRFDAAQYRTDFEGKCLGDLLRDFIERASLFGCPDELRDDAGYWTDDVPALLFLEDSLVFMSTVRSVYPND